MDLREAADILGVHYRTACAWVREAPRLIHVRDWVAQAQALYPAITGGQETRARHQVDRLASGVRHIGLCEQVIAPALRRLGDDVGGPGNFAEASGNGGAGDVHARAAPAGGRGEGRVAQSLCGGGGRGMDVGAARAADLPPPGGSEGGKRSRERRGAEARRSAAGSDVVRADTAPIQGGSR